MQIKANKVVKAALIAIIIVLICSTGVTLFLYYQKLANISEIYDDYAEENVQNRLLEEVVNNNENIDVNNTSTTTLMETKNDEDVLGVIKIDKIKYEGLVYDGTSLETLAKGVGHFENSPYFEGNVCLAAHNTIQHWAKLNTVELGDKIIYTSFLGTKTYKVSTVKQIDETDWEMLKNTKDNRITLITCVKGVPTQRLCVQGIEIN